MEALSLFRQGTKESTIRLGQVAQEIVDMAPESPLGYNWLAWYNWSFAQQGKSFQESMTKAFKLAQKSLSLDESIAITHTLLGNIYRYMRQYEKAIVEGERSVELEPNSADINGAFGASLCCVGRIDEGIARFKQAIRLNPFPVWWYYSQLGVCYRMNGLYEEALTEFKKALARNPNALHSNLGLTVVYILLDRQEEARNAAKEILKIDPNFSVKVFSKVIPYKNRAEVKLIVDALNKAGLK